MVHFRPSCLTVLLLTDELIVGEIEVGKERFGGKGWDGADETVVFEVKDFEVGLFVIDIVRREMTRELVVSQEEPFELGRGEGGQRSLQLIKRQIQRLQGGKSRYLGRKRTVELIGTQINIQQRCQQTQLRRNRPLQVAVGNIDFNNVVRSITNNSLPIANFFWR